MKSRSHPPPLAHLFSILEVNDRSLLWCAVPVCPVHVPLQGAVILLAPGKGVVCRDLLPCLMVGERKWMRVLILKGALQVSLGQLGFIVHSKGVKMLLLHIAFENVSCR